MGTPMRRSAVSNLNIRRTNGMMRLIITAFMGVIFGFYLGVSSPMISLTKVALPSSIFSSFDLSYIEDRYSGLSTQTLLNLWSSLKGRGGSLRNFVKAKVWIPTNPRGAERLPPGLIAAESDMYARRRWGLPEEDLKNKPRYLVTFTVGHEQRENIDAAARKFSSNNFTILLFHYDGWTSEWDKFEWSKRAIHVSVRKQTKWWYAKRFLHPDIVAPYDYIFIWDEDLGVENFDPEEYIRLVRKHDLEISQPGLSPDGGMTWQMTMKRDDTEVHKTTDEKSGWCPGPQIPPCAAFVEIMAPVFSRKAWRCVWHLIQNDLVHGWGLDFVLRMCVEPAHEKIGVVDSQWVIHQTVPSLGNQGQTSDGRAPWEGVRERCFNEWSLFAKRLAKAERIYYQAMGIQLPNSTGNS